MTSILKYVDLMIVYSCFLVNRQLENFHIEMPFHNVLLYASLEGVVLSIVYMHFHSLTVRGVPVFDLMNG